MSLKLVASIALAAISAIAISQTAAPAGQLIEVAPANDVTIRLATAPKDALDKAAEAVDDPNPDAFTATVLDSAHKRNEQQWEQAFASSVLAAYRQDAAKAPIPFEYPPRIPEDGLDIVQGLANAVLRAHLRCESIYTVDSISEGHGWRLICDHKKETYVVKLIGHDWKLLQVR